MKKIQKNCQDWFLQYIVNCMHTHECTQVYTHCKSSTSPCVCNRVLVGNVTHHTTSHLHELEKLSIRLRCKSEGRQQQRDYEFTVTMEKFITYPHTHMGIISMCVCVLIQTSYVCMYICAIPTADHDACTKNRANNNNNK